MQMHDYAEERQRTLSSESEKMEGREKRKETEKGKIRKTQNRNIPKGSKLC